MNDEIKRWWVNQIKESGGNISYSYYPNTMPWDLTDKEIKNIYNLEHNI